MVRTLVTISKLDNRVGVSGWESQKWRRLCGKFLLCALGNLAGPLLQKHCHHHWGSPVSKQGARSHPQLALLPSTETALCNLSQHNSLTRNVYEVLVFIMPQNSFLRDCPQKQIRNASHSWKCRKYTYQATALSSNMKTVVTLSK